MSTTERWSSFLASGTFVAVAVVATGVVDTVELEGIDECTFEGDTLV